MNIALNIIPLGNLGFYGISNIFGVKALKVSFCVNTQLYTNTWPSFKDILQVKSNVIMVSPPGLTRSDVSHQSFHLLFGGGIRYGLGLKLDKLVGYQR